MGYRIKLIFSKTGDARYISHLDLMRLFQRASRRANLPVTITKGFNPHLKISVTRALKLGVESQNEEAIFSMDEKVSPEALARTINDKLPDGVRIQKCEEIG